ncbi:MAG: septum formation protein Maf [Lentisphaerae bacterium]|nr:septum formation protein Maf [Lentisphaerota bacterium]MCP4100127.1 septum formation protein Maf [Lentisphaerota bacterium]
MQLILASNSERRKILLKEMGLDFVQVPSFTVEVGAGDCYCSDVPLVNASRKADDIATNNPQSLVIGADTVIEWEDTIIGKPQDIGDAKRILMILSGSTHSVVTGVALRCGLHSIRVDFAEYTRVKFKNFSEKNVDEYLNVVHVLDKAGAYAIQEYGEMLVDSIDGPLDNVIGLPCTKLSQSLNACSLLFK